MRALLLVAIVLSTAAAGYVGGHFVANREWAENWYPVVARSDQLSDAGLAMTWIEYHDRGETDVLRRRMHAVATINLFPPAPPEVPTSRWFETAWQAVGQAFSSNSDLYKKLEARDAESRVKLEARFRRICDKRMPESEQYEKLCGR
jgi:hypothetical protein